MIQTLSGKLFGEITYFYIDDKTKHGFLIDPGADAGKIIKKVQENGWTIEKILLTHGHIDHIWSAQEVRAALGAPIVIHEQGGKYLEDPTWNLSEGFLGEAITFTADEYVTEGEEIALKSQPNFKVKVIYAPGHTLDGVAYYDERNGLLFAGDIIFKSSVGRSDLPGGNSLKLLNAIRSQIFTLPGETIIYPGHGEQTTVLYEKETNPAFHFYD